MKPHLLLICLTLTFTTYSQQINQKLKAIQLLTNTFNNPDTTIIYYLGDLVLYETTITNQFGQGSVFVVSEYHTIDPANGDTTFHRDVELKNDNSPDSISITRAYFVHHMDSAYGYYYNPRAIFNIKRITVKQGRGFVFMTNEDTFLTMKPDSSIWNSDHSELKQVYIQPARKDTPLIKIIFSFKKNMPLSMTISDKLSQDRKMTFYRMEILFGEYFDQTSNQLIPAQTVMDFALREYIPLDTKTIYRYFDRYNIDVEEKK